MPPIELLPLHQAAMRVRTPANTLKEFAEQGDIPSITYDGELWFREDILQQLRERLVNETSRAVSTNPAIPRDGLLKPGEVARMFNVDKKTVRTWGEKGKVQMVRTPGGARRYPASQFRALLEPSTPTETATPI